MTDRAQTAPEPAVQVLIGAAPTATTPTTAPGPVIEGERLLLLDVLRGFALLGIFLANFGGVRGGAWAEANEFAYTVLDIFVINSFRPLFGLLFGIGFAIHFERARQRGGGGVHLYIRRVLALFLIGTVHAVVIWQGDILVHYALIALVLIPLHRLPTPAIGLLAVALFLFNMFPSTSESTLQRPDAPRAAVAAELASGVANEQRLIIGGLDGMAGTPRSAAWVEAFRERWHRYAEGVVAHADWRRFTVSDSLLAFLIGLFIGRGGYMRDPRRHKRLLLAVAVGGTVLAAAGYGYGRMGIDWGDEAQNLARYAADLFPALVYLAVIALVLARASRCSARLSILAPAGRMALTNYLMQSVVMTMILYPYGLNLSAPGTALMIVLQTAFFFLVQIPLSRWWLSRYHFGPVEWVWRSLTYGGRQPGRRAMTGFPAPLTTPAS